MEQITGIELGNRRALRPGPWRWARALGWMVAFFAVVLVVTSTVQGAILASGGHLGGGGATEIAQRLASQTGWPVALAGVLAAIVGLGIYVGGVRLAEDRRVPELSLAPAAKELVFGLGLGLSMMVVTVAIMAACGWVTVTRSPITGVWSALGYSVQSGFVEELLFRGILLRLAWRALGPWFALALSAALFGGAHLTNPNASAFAAVCIAVEAGLMLASFYVLTGRLWMSIGVHAGWNFTQGWLAGAAVSGTDLFAGGPFSTKAVPGVADWLTGTGFGPEASLAGLSVGTLVGAGVLWLAWKRGRFPNPPQPAEA